MSYYVCTASKLFLILSSPDINKKEKWTLWVQNSKDITDSKSLASVTVVLFFTELFTNKQNINDTVLVLLNELELYM
jgi:hypothetical protein